MGVVPDRPRVQFEVQPDGLMLTWGPKIGPFGIFREDMVDHPVEVEIKKWVLFVNEILGQGDNIEEIEHPGAPDMKPKPIFMKPIFNESVGTETARMIQSNQLPKNKTVVVQVFGIFDSQKINGDPYSEGIYSDEVRITIPKIH